MKQARSAHRHIAAELVEKILLNLPVKSLLRFTTVSKSWNSMILGGDFAARYRGRELMALRVYSCSDDQKYLVSPISTLSTAAPPFSLPFNSNWYSEVSCSGLRCTEVENTLCLYNLSTRAYRKLPAPSCPPRIGSSITGGGTTSSVYVYGLGYGGGDYKIIKAHLKLYGETELYSLKSDRWRKLSDSERRINLCISGDARRGIRFLTRKGVFVSGALHWLVWHTWPGGGGEILSGIDILNFDVSAEEFGKTAMPPLPESFCKTGCSSNKLDVCVLRGRLGVCVDYCRSFVVWVMEECGNWKKDLAIDYGHIYPLRYSYLRPFYFYDAGGSVVKAVTSPTDIRKFFVYKNGSSTLEEKSFGSEGYGIVASFTYVESLVSPFAKGKTSTFQ